MGIPVTSPPKVIGKTLLQAAWEEQVARIVNALAMSGTTAQRPTVLLWAGRPYFDESLGAGGRPIWRDKTNANWRDSAGTVV